VKAIELGNKCAMNNLERFYKTKHTNNTKLTEKIQLVKIDICPICFMEIKVIPFDCTYHYFCINCTCQIDKCALCRLPKN
jgi:hypothetical protein